MTTGRDAEAVTFGRETFDGAEAVVARWDFSVRGGTFGADESNAFERACAEVVATRTPLVTVLRSGGTRLQEGMHALVGIPRATLALQGVAAACVPHISVADHPTTGGVWVAIGAVADIRAAVRGSTLGFSGPRVVEAMTGSRLPPGANTAESAAAAGLVDALLDADEVAPWLGLVLRTVHGEAATTRPDPTVDAADLAVPPRHGWAQVVHSRTCERAAGRDLVGALLPEPVWLAGADASVAAAAGRVHGRAVVAVAVAAARAGRVTPAGYRLLGRAAALADRLAVPLLTLVDTAGADPMPASEDSGLAAEIATALGALMRCGSPTVAVVHGEGGSGGALAAAVTDVVAVTDTGWFAALAPEGAAAALRTTPADAADVMRVAPADLLADGFADEVAPSDPAALAAWAAGVLDRLGREDPAVRRRRRHDRWAGPLPGSGIRG